MFSQLKERFVDWWTKTTKFDRDLRKWTERNINIRAHTIKQYYHGMEYIITLDYKKAFYYECLGCHYIDPELFKYTIYGGGGKAIGEHTLISIFRGEFGPHDQQFYIHDFGSDYVFAATNVEEDALMISLKWGG